MSLTSSFRGTTRDTINFSKCASWAARPSNVESIGSGQDNDTHPSTLEGRAREHTKPRITTVNFVAG